MASLVLGCLSGGGEAHAVVTERRNGAGMTITINGVPPDVTKGQREELFDQDIQPSFLARAGKIPAGVPLAQRLKEARRLNKPGRPPL